MSSQKGNSREISLDDLQKRICGTDLIPSRASLLDGLEEKIDLLKKHGILSLAVLRNELKTSKQLAALSSATGINEPYLTLLRREIEGYFPKFFALKEIDWLPDQDIKKMEQAGLKNAADLLQVKDPAGVSVSCGLEVKMLEDLIRMAHLTRIQWVSPLFARMLLEAGYDSPVKVASADPDQLCIAIRQINEKNAYFNGVIGLRDIKRLVYGAIFADWSEKS